MHERIVEILLFLVNELHSNKQLNDVDVTLLTRNGYTQSEISTAFSWLFEQIAADQSTIVPGEPAKLSHRVLSEPEKTVISAEAHGYLLQSNELGLVSAVEVEAIIDRITGAGFGSVGVPEMKTFIAGVLFDGDRTPRGGSSLAIGSNDTIH